MLNLTTQVDFHARVRPDALALAYDDQRLSWRDLQARVRVTAAGLRERGVGPDSIVAMLMKNSAAFIELLYAISHLGAVSLPLNFRLAREEIDYILGHSGAMLLVADDEFRDTVEGIGVATVILDDAARHDSRAAFGGAGEIIRAHRREAADLMRLMYTSGTTDRPKGVMHSYGNFFAKNFDMINNLQLDANERLGVVGPLYHVGAADLPGLAVHCAGGALFVQREFRAEAALRMIAAEGITGIWLAPVMTGAILHQDPAGLPDLGSLRWCIGGGERTPEQRIRDFRRIFPNARYIDGYGLTETVSGDVLMEPGREIEKIGSVGRPMSLVEVEIRGEDGAPLPWGEVGEICLRGPKVTKGYWKDEARTRAAMLPDGFFRSGDMGYLDSEGFLFLTDRKKDMIISGGENIASSEVERVIFEMEQVMDVAVIAQPDPQWGEVPVAVVTLRPGAALDFDLLNAHCRARLAGFKCPKALHIVAELPRNPSGKILKRVLREQIAAGKA